MTEDEMKVLDGFKAGKAKAEANGWTGWKAWAVGLIGALAVGATAWLYSGCGTVIEREADGTMRVVLPGKVIDNKK